MRKTTRKRASPKPAPTPMGLLVIEAARQAKLRLGLRDEEIAKRLAPLIGERVGRSAVSNWITGQSRPRAEVLLGLVKLAGPRVSLDELLFGESLGDRLDRAEQGLADLRTLIEKR